MQERTAVSIATLHCTAAASLAARHWVRPVASREPAAAALRQALRAAASASAHLEVSVARVVACVVPRASALAAASGLALVLNTGRY